MAEVSIIIPCYNQGHYLVRALASVLGQDFADWEAIVVDDGSTDGTAAVAQGHEDERVRYRYQENRGLAGARNTSLSMAEGRYVAFLDADDEWEPNFLGRCVASLQKAPEAVGALVGSRFIDETGRVLPQGARRPAARPAAGDFRRRLLAGGFFPVHAAMVRRPALLKSGGFDESLTSLEDWDLWLRLSAQGEMIAIEEPLAHYRVYAGSMSTDAERMQANRLAVLAKHFGPATGDAAEWPEEKRYAYGFAHRAAGLAYLEQGAPDRCWQEMAQAVAYWPGILGRLDTYYELSCGSQAKGYRGRPTADEVRANGALVVDRLATLFEQGDGDLRALRRQAFGRAYLALGMLADQACDWALARGYLRQAVRRDWRLAGESGFLRRLMKVHAGQRIARMLGSVEKDQ